MSLRLGDSLVQSLSCVFLWTHGLQHIGNPLLPNSLSLFKLMSIESIMPYQPAHPLLPSSPPALDLSQHQGHLNESALDIRWPEYWSFSFSISSQNIQGWFPLGLMDLIFMLSKGLSRVFSSTTVRKYQLLGAQTSLWRNYHIHTWLLEKNIALIRWTFVNKVMSLILNILSKFVIAFLPRGKCLLISWLQSPSAVILEPNKIKPIIVSIFSPSIWYEVMGPKATILVFWMFEF